MEETLQITSGANEYKQITDNGNVIWQRAVSTNSTKGNTTTINNTRKVGGNFTATNVMSSAKVYGNSKQGELPSGYTQLEYIQSSGTQWIDTGISPAGKKIGAVVDFQFTVTSRATGGVFGSNKSDGTDNCQFTVYSSKWRIKINNYATYGATYDTNRHTARCNMSDGTSLDSTVYTTTQYTIASGNTNNVYVGACNYGNDSTTATYALIGKLYSAKVYDDTTLLHNFIPAKDSSNVIGMYDLVSGQFFTNAGTGSFTAGSEVKPTPTNPIEVKGVGERTENLFNPDNANTRYPDGWFSTGNVVSVASGSNRTVIIPCSEGDVFTFKHYTEASGARYFWIYSDTVASGKPCSAMYGTMISTDTITTTAAPSNAKYIGICFWRTTAGTVQSAADDFVVVKGSTTPTSYIPYGYQINEQITINGNSTTHTDYISAPLEKVGTYEDNLDIQTSVITRNVGVKVFDGTETFTSSGVLDNCWAYTTRLESDTTFTDRTIWCTHFRHSSTLPSAENRQGYALLGKVSTGTQEKPAGKYVGFGAITDYPTLADFQTFLATQYANGTPVTIYYPLANSTTSSITANPISLTEKGTHTLENTNSVKGQTQATYLGM